MSKVCEARLRERLRRKEDFVLPTLTLLAEVLRVNELLGMSGPTDQVLPCPACGALLLATDDAAAYLEVVEIHYYVRTHSQTFTLEPHICAMTLFG